MNGENLASCPVCGGEIAAGASVCPDCTADINSFRKLIEDARRYLDAARLALARGDKNEVERLCTDALKLWDGCAGEAKALLAKTAIVSGDFEAARKRLSEIPEGAERVRLAEELERAEQKLFAAAERYNVALTCARKAQYRESISQLEKAIELAPDLKQAYRLLAKANIALGDFEAARAAVSKGLLRFPGDAELAQLETEFSDAGKPFKGAVGFPFASPGFVAAMLMAQTALLAIILVLLAVILFSSK
ncbi:MAG: tetratricopeptide repeat protein [bacterium]|jgi:tetratricopeptide (TPR) repeat protein